ncbi:MAG: sigma factor [Bryobacterales bacterium]
MPILDDPGRTDEELIAAYRAGSDEAFEAIYARRFAELTAYLRRRLPAGAQDDAEDLAETALYKAAVQVESFDPARGAFRPWLYAIATNLRRDLIRSWTRRLERLWAASPERAGRRPIRIVRSRSGCCRRSA